MHPRPCTLPVELWCLVFSYLPFRDRLAAMRVCRSWRKIALDAKTALWAQIRWRSGERHLRSLTTRFKLAGPATLVDLHVRFLDRPLYFTNLLCFLEECIPRLRSLELHASHRLELEDFLALSRILSTARAPHLESFTLKAYMDISDPLFSGDCPKLHHVSLDGVTLESQDVTYPAVTTLVYAFAVLRLPGSINHLLTQFPNIEVLKLDARNYKKSRNPLDTLPLWPPKFRSLILYCEFWGSLSLKVVQLIPHKSIENVEYVVCVDSGLKSFPSDVELVFFSDLRPSELHASFQTYLEKSTPMLELCFEDRSGFRRVFDAPHRPHLAFAPGLMDGLFNKIATLDINEHDMVKLLLRRSKRLELLNLNRLNLYLFDEREHREERNWLTPFLVDDDYSAIVPQLTEVHFTAQDISYLAPEMVSGFILRQLGRGPRAWAPLNVIGFHNIRLLQNRVDAVASMLQLTTDIQFTNTPLTWISAKINELPEDAIDFS